jgi:hypothetical protein
MKKALFLFSFFFLLVLLSGCLSTLYPIFKVNDVVFNENLLGYWNCSGFDEKIRFMEFKRIPSERKSELSGDIRLICDKGYLLQRMDSSRQVIEENFVFLAKIGENYYLDFYPAEMLSQKKVHEIYKKHFIKVHKSYKYDFKDKNHFEISRFDKEFLDKLISNNKINIRHEVLDGTNVITASTEDLQKFIIQYSSDPHFFSGTVNCTRIIDY